MNLTPAVLSHIRAEWPESQWPYLEHLAKISARETARECKAIATEIDDNDGFRSGTGERIAALIANKYGVTK